MIRLHGSLSDLVVPSQTSWFPLRLRGSLSDLVVPSPEYLNNVLASGEVSNLFARDELDDIAQDLVPVMKRDHPRRPPTSENLYEYFLSRVRRHLHVVLCFSPVGGKFRSRALKVSRRRRAPPERSARADL